MQYITVEWTHSHPSEPVRLYHEVNEQRFEQRKIEVFRDGLMQTADQSHETGTTALSYEPMPTFEEISQDKQFRAREISEEDFNHVWTQALGNTPNRPR